MNPTSDPNENDPRNEWGTREWYQETQRLSAEIEQYLTVLRDIAGQSKYDELGDDAENADFEGAYDIMIQLARSVTTKDKFICRHCGHVSENPSMTHQCLPDKCCKMCGGTGTVCECGNETLCPRCS